MARSKTATVLWQIVDDAGGDRAKVYTAARISESILGRGLNDKQPIGDKMIERIAIAFPRRAKDLLEAWRVDRAEQAAQKAVDVATQLGIALAPPPAHALPLAPVWDRLDGSRRKAVVQLAEILAGAAPGEWIAGQVASFEAVARLHPLQAGATGA